ncbi:MULTISPECIES: hypothetical protein [unclassified Streptomyces]|uniref:XRE family toxin-antitoxin system, antitoxin component n=1 Tax=Streptomyces sp. F12 TaxID=1436084 RepID=V9ZAF0_9ACTN|nr:hypothetical protein [Streptomyces sp. F12]AHE40406.1 XRE family toxin-antitoxin system, antitoxin component [Streptomyces sp. F12]
MAHEAETTDTGTPEPTGVVPVPGPGAPFHERLNYLFDRVRPPGGKEFSNAHVAREISSYSNEVSITGAYIGQLRRGEKTPTIKLPPLFARFFGVKPRFFFEDEERQNVTEQFELLRKLTQAGVKQIALRAIGLSSKGRGEVMKKLDAVREEEGLPPASDEDLL